MMTFTNSKTTSFFSVIPIDAVNTIWNHTDALTRYELLLGIFEPFQNDIAELVDSIMVYNGNNMIHSDGTIAVNGCETDITIRKILEKFGTAIQSLELRFCSPDMNFLVRRKCPNIRSLFFPLEFRDIEIIAMLRHIGKNLEVLEIESRHESRTKQIVSDIASTCVNLKKFSFRGKGIEFLNRLWLLIGNNLEQISLRSIDENLYAWGVCLDSIRLNCRRLNSLALSGPFMGERNVSELLVSYGEQLQEAVVSQIDALGSLNVAKACTHLRRCIIIEKDAEFRRVKAFGPALHELFLHLDLDSNLSELRKVSQGCANLERLVIECKEVIPYVPFIFTRGGKKSRLRKLEMNIETLRAEDMNLIGHSTGNLESMSIAAMNFEEGSRTNNIFKEFAMSNRRLLRLCVSIAVQGTFTERGKECEPLIRFSGGIADSFRPCKSLESIQISSRKSNLSFLVAPGKELWAKFSCFFHRRVFVSLFGNRVCPTRAVQRFNESH